MYTNSCLSSPAYDYDSKANGVDGCSDSDSESASGDMMDTSEDNSKKIMSLSLFTCYSSMCVW